MKISVLDGSNYFRGLLLLIRKDRKIDEFEAVMMERIGMKLGFEKEFCTRAIHDVLENVHIVDEAPLFSSKEIAKKFIQDGLTIAFSDSILHPAEEKWLMETVDKNGLDQHWFFKQREIMSNKCEFPERLEVDDLTMI